MPRYQIDKDVYEAAGPAALVNILALESFAPAKSAKAWMEQASARMCQQTGHPIRHDTPENFVADAIAAGLIKEMN